MPEDNALIHLSQQTIPAGKISTGQIASWPGGTTPMPNFLLDQVMPTLSDTQWRLLCVIARQTLGWQVGKGKSGQRKQRDWLTHAQLKARTGRASAALCKAVDELVRRHLIEVQDAQGRPLSTPHERRRARSQLFYRLNPVGLHFEGLSIRKEEGDVSQREMVKSAAMKDAAVKRLLFSHSEFHKVKTTKENETKDNLKNHSLLFSESEKHSSFGKSDTQIGTTPTISLTIPAIQAAQESVIKPQSDPSGQDMARKELSVEADVLETTVESFIECYRELYRLKPGAERVPPISNADRDLLRQRLKQHPALDLEKWLPVFFASTFGYVRRRHYSLESFLESVHILQAATTKQRVVWPQAKEGSKTLR